MFFKVKNKITISGTTSCNMRSSVLKKTKKQRIFCELLPSENWQLGPAGCYHWQEVYQLTVQQSPPTRLQLGLTGPNVGPKDLSIREISWFNESINSTILKYV